MAFGKNYSNFYGYLNIFVSSSIFYVLTILLPLSLFHIELNFYFVTS